MVGMGVSPAKSVFASATGVLPSFRSVCVVNR